MASSEGTKVYSLEEIKKHNDGRACWIVIHDKVYDATRFLEEVYMLLLIVLLLSEGFLLSNSSHEGIA